MHVDKWAARAGHVQISQISCAQIGKLASLLAVKLRLRRGRTSMSGCLWAARVVFFGGGLALQDLAIVVTLEAVIPQRTCAQGLFMNIIS